MFNRNSDNKGWLKTMHILMIGALFFAQLQLKFIEYAYGNDYGKTSVANASKQTDAKQRITAKADNRNSNYCTKLNKRYPISSLFTVPLVSDVAHFHKPISTLQIHYHQPLFTNHFKYLFSLRGPPSAYC